MKAITELDAEGLAGLFQSLGEPKYRAEQVRKWVYQRGALSFDAMTDLPKRLREGLAKDWTVATSRVAAVSEAKDGTRKLLIAFADGECVEAVPIPDGERLTLCVSTQVGCPIRCVFCASGLGGVKRNLEAHEIVEQVLHATNDVAAHLDRGEKRVIGNLVFMGMGEPLANYDALVGSLRVLSAPWAMGIGTNRITVSTVGLLDKMERFAEEAVATNLAVSLHAPNDEVRARVIPLLKEVGVDALIAGAVRYRRTTGKDVTFEYVLLDGVNAGEEHARELAARVRGTGCKVNLIPHNHVEEIDLRAPSREACERFEAVLLEAGVKCTIRRRRGDDVEAACGQLRLRSAPRDPDPKSQIPTKS